MQTIIIDGNAIGYASQHSSPLTNDGKPVQAIFGFLKTLRKIKNDHPGHIIVLWDCKAQFRFDILPTYKSGRKKTPKQLQDREDYSAQRPIIRELLGLLGIDQIEAEGFEADDLAGFFANRASTSRADLLMVTGDEDWAQLVLGPNIRWYDPRRDGKWITDENFIDMTGYANPNRFLWGKAAQGDNSDDIDGIEGLGKKAAIEIFDYFDPIQIDRHYRSQGDFTKASVPQGFNTRFIKPLNRLASPEGRDKFIRNMRLMALGSNLQPIKELATVTRGKTDIDAFFGRCLDLNFSSITSRPQPWLKTFGE